MNRPIVAAIRYFLMFSAAAAFCVAPAKANLITNPGFETGDFTGWTVLGPGFVTGTFGGVTPHSGNFQAAFPFGDSLIQSVVTIPGGSYTIDFFLANQGFPFNLFSVTWGSTIFVLTNQSPFGYTEYTFHVTASTASTSLQFHFLGGDFSSPWFLDDISVNFTGIAVPDAGSTLPLLGFASLGLAALRRKLSC